MKLFSQKKKPSADSSCRNEASNYTKGLEFVLNKDGNSYEVAGIGTAYTNYDIVIPCEHKGMTVTGICNGAFKALESITGVTIPDSVTSIGASAFYGCTGLTSITLGNGVKSIGDEALAYCSGLTSITLPDSVTDIGASAFYCCTRLTGITACDSITHIGVSAFAGTAHYNDKSNWKKGVLYADKYLIDAERTISGAYEVKDGTICVADSAFCNCEKLTSLILPDTVKGIGDNAFSGCSALESITLPFVGKDLNATKASALFGYIFGTSSYEGSTEIEYVETYKDSIAVTYYIPTRLKSVTVIGGNIPRRAFENCKGLTSITLGDKVKDIDKMAFYGCTGLTSITLGKSVTSIGWRAFEDCTSLTSINMSDNITSTDISAFHNTGYYNDKSNWENGVLYIGKYLIDVRNTAFKEYKVKEGTLGIAGSAFSRCAELTSITIPNSVKSIEAYAFHDCAKLTNVTIPVNVKSIEQGTFEGCTALTSIAMPNTLTNIGWGAFKGCTSLKKISIPDSVTSISNTAFLNTGYYNDKSNWENEALYIGKHLITASPKIPKAFTIKDGTICVAGFTFSECKKLKSVTFPNSITSLDSCMFVKSGIKSIVIPVSVKSIAHETLFCCTKLKSIKYRGTKEQWDAIPKEPYWDCGTKNYTVTYNYEGK